MKPFLPGTSHHMLSVHCDLFIYPSNHLVSHHFYSVQNVLCTWIWLPINTFRASCWATKVVLSLSILKHSCPHCHLCDNWYKHICMHIIHRLNTQSDTVVLALLPFSCTERCICSVWQGRHILLMFPVNILDGLQWVVVQRDSICFLRNSQSVYEKSSGGVTPGNKMYSEYSLNYIKFSI